MPRWILMFGSCIPASALAFAPLVDPPTSEGALSGEDEADDEQLPEVDDDVGHAVVNGTPTSSYKGVVALLAYDPVNGYGGVFCSGTHITGRWVLTAAHCVDAILTEYVGYDVYVMYTSKVYTEPFDGIKVKRGIVHPAYNRSTIMNDIGLVELTSSRSGAGSMVLNDEAVSSSWFGKPLTFVGYGVTGDGRQDEGVKRYTQIPVRACMNPSTGYEESCSASAAVVIYSESSSTNVCSGDSGGAAIEVTPDGKWELAGVNSFVTPDCNNGGNGATRVDKYISWIKGYAPTAMTEPGGSDPDPDPDTDIDPDPDVEPDTGWGDPERPEGGAYERPMLGMCSATGAAPGGAWMVVGGLLISALRRRRSPAPPPDDGPAR